jgi:hypothetical protein
MNSLCGSFLLSWASTIGMSLHETSLDAALGATVLDTLAAAMPASERTSVGLLTESTRRYHEAIHERCDALIATEHFFRERVVYQWRLDAVEVLERAARWTETASGLDCTTTYSTSAVNGVEEDEGLAAEDSAFKSAVSMDAEISARRQALKWILDEISTQKTAAISSLEDRATHYALLVRADNKHLSSARHSERVALTEAERGDALEHYRNLARDTFNEFESEAHVICEVSLGSSGMSQLCLALERRRAFWQSQLEETWSAWQAATLTMHRAGEDALIAWGTIKKALGLDMYVARALEVELLDPLGMSGLSDAFVEGTDTQAFSREKRFEALGSAVDLLFEAQALHEVGPALIQVANSIEDCPSRPLLPAEFVSTAILEICDVMAASSCDSIRNKAKSPKSNSFFYQNEEKDATLSPTANPHVDIVKPQPSLTKWWYHVWLGV